LNRRNLSAGKTQLTPYFAAIYGRQLAVVFTA